MTIIYSITDVSLKMNIEERTLKFYSKEGLFPLVKKTPSGALKFTEDDFEWLELLTCLRKTGASLHELKDFSRAYAYAVQNKSKNNIHIYGMLKSYEHNAEKRLKEFENNVNKIKDFIARTENRIQK